MKRYLYILFVVVVFALQACGGASSEPVKGSGDGSALIPPIVSNEADSGASGAAGAAPSGASVPALCSGAQNTNTASFAAEVIRLVNVERAKVKPALTALANNSKLEQAAQTHAIDMACNFFLSHTGSDGSYINDRMTRFGYSYNWWGENVAAGQTTPAAVMAAFMGSPVHKANILSVNFTEIGIGYVYNPNDVSPGYKHYWSMSLASPQ